MSLRMVMRSDYPLNYVPSARLQDDPTPPFGVWYNEDILGETYGETLAGLTSNAYRIADIWSASDQGFNVFAVTEKEYYPGFGASLWRYTRNPIRESSLPRVGGAQSIYEWRGRSFRNENERQVAIRIFNYTPHLHDVPLASALRGIVGDPWGRTFTWDFNGSPWIQRANFTEGGPGGSSYWGYGGSLSLSNFVDSGDFLDADGEPVVGGIELFGIDLSADRLFVQWSGQNDRTALVYKISTREFLDKRIYTPGKMAGITCTRDGFLYAYDETDWICVYDYDGVFQGAMRNPRRQTYLGANGGISYYWHHGFRILLSIAGTADDPETGECTCSVLGFAPQPAAYTMSPPIPRKVPRVGRRTVFYTHLFGEGAEPLGGVIGRGTLGATVQQGLTDRDGDFHAQVSPSTDDSLSVNVTVETDIPPESEEPY